ncbi:hypothetical protein BGZ61DRAFT_477209 [Ilyonectria robusta]|uniref:uncharacterized protein n=1 Tax=Ilyonectria robusta TaxID=1079257 RepID=UPI001E8CE400|nr:uncharacterized protein BGZ61DRAFT_477209 [Ilyonectria robusta]KAH8706580.1 hypothetical protein BGZ61DRAFT_477209 [Ilyonectria robusta]
MCRPLCCVSASGSLSQPVSRPVLWQAPIGVHSIFQASRSLGCNEWVPSERGERSSTAQCSTAQHSTVQRHNQAPVHQSYQTPERGNWTTAAGGCAPLVAGPQAEEKVTLTEEMQAAGPVRRGTIDSGHRSRPPASEAHTTTREERGSVGEDTGRHGEARRGTGNDTPSVQCAVQRCADTAVQRCRIARAREAAEANICPPPMSLWCSSAQAPARISADALAVESGTLMALRALSQLPSESPHPLA